MKVYTQDYINYTLAGVCTFLSDETLKIMGYGNYKNLYPNRKSPILVYSKNGELEGVLFGEIDGKHKMIHPEIINELWNLETGQDLYPELFI